MIGLFRIRTRRRLLWPVLFALALRLVAAVWVDDRTHRMDRRGIVAGDAGGYLDLAADVAAGREYAVSSGVHPRRAMRVPLFPILLAGPLALADRLDDVKPTVRMWPCRFAVALCGTLAVWGVGRLGDVVGGTRVGAVAAWLAAVNPLGIAFSTMLLSESLFAALLVLSSAGVAECVRRDPLNHHPVGDIRWGPAIWGGLAAAGACLTRPVWLPFLPCVGLLGLWLAWRSGDVRRARWAAIYGAAFLVGFAPWPLRNQAALGEPVFTTTWGGATLYDSLGPQATGASDMRFRDVRYPRAEEFGSHEEWSQKTWRHWLDRKKPKLGADEGAVPPEFRPVFNVLMERREPSRLQFVVQLGPHLVPAVEDTDLLDAVRGDEVASDRLYRRSAWRAAAADPARVARLAVVKQGRFWRPWPVGRMPGGAIGGLLKAGFAAFFLSLIGLAVWGGVRLWRDGGGEVGRVWAFVLTWGPILGFAAVCLVFVGSVRYRLPGEFPLCVAAAVGGLDLWGRRSASRTQNVSGKRTV